MSNNQNKNEGVPGLVKILIALGAIGGAIFIVYYAVTNVFGAGTSAYKSLYQQEYQAFLTKLANYTTQNGSSSTGLTATQQQALQQETAEMNQTLKGLAAAANAPYNLAYSVVATLIGAVCATAFIIKFFGPSFQTWVNRRLGLTGKTAFTQYAISYATIGAVADELNSMGGIAVTQATNMINSAQQMFTTQSLPQMQTLQAGLQADLATLTGLELLAAQEMISLLTYEMAYIPTTLLIPPLAVP